MKSNFLFWSSGTYGAYTLGASIAAVAFAVTGRWAWAGLGVLATIGAAVCFLYQRSQRL